MNVASWDASLREVIRVPGVLGALVISADDGLVVAESAMEEVATEDVAALAAALIVRATRCNAAMRMDTPTSLQLVAEEGALLAVAGPEPLWMVAVARQDAELGRVRLLLRDFAVALH